jgi:hypothetical protein
MARSMSWIFSLFKGSFSFSQGFLRDCPNGKLDKKKFIDVYKQFYPQGKADSFCK